MRIQNIIKLFPLGVLLTLLGIMASVSPVDARANLSKWIASIVIYAHDHSTIVLLGTIIFTSAYVAFVWDVRLTRKSKPEALNDGKAEFDIVIGHDGHYVESNSFNAINVMKTVFVAIKNTGNAYLTNCKVMFEVHNPNSNTPEKWLREDSFSLLKGEQKYLSLAAYNERLSPDQVMEEWIRPSAPPSGNYWQAPMIPKEGGTITITASTVETSPRKIICKLWVTDGKLCWAKA
jgi:hypothetical protein